MTSDFILMMLGIIVFGVGLGMVGVALIDWVARWQKRRHPVA
jgi:NhaP-type Na+/H+ or K+/H+ antiporter